MNQNASNLFPNLETERLWLRQEKKEDAEAVFAIFCDPKVTQFHSLNAFARVDEASRLINRRTRDFAAQRRIRWGIALKPDNYLIGSGGFTWKENNSAEIGYELASKFWRRGIMSEALSSILGYGFEVKGLKFVVAEVMPANIASKKLLAKLGFQSQQVMFGRGFWHGKYHDLERFELVKDCFRSRL